MPPSLHFVLQKMIVQLRHTTKDEDKISSLTYMNVKDLQLTYRMLKVFFVTEQGNLPLSSKLSKKEQVAIIFPELRSSSVLSLVQLCNDDCDIVLNKKKKNFRKENELILQGTRYKLDGLWDIPVYKKKTSDTNFKTPIKNGTLHIKQKPRISHLLNTTKYKYTSQEFKTTIPNTFCNKAQDIIHRVQ